MADAQRDRILSQGFHAGRTKVCNCRCIPTKNRNKCTNRCVNIWSLFVFIGFILCIAGGISMYLRSDRVIRLITEDFDRQQEIFERIKDGDVGAINEVPDEVKKTIVGVLKGEGIVPDDFDFTDLNKETLVMWMDDATEDEIAAAQSKYGSEPTEESFNESPPACAAYQDQQYACKKETYGDGSMYTECKYENDDEWLFDYYFDNHDGNGRQCYVDDDARRRLAVTKFVRRRLVGGNDPDENQRREYRNVARMVLAGILALSLVAPILVTLGLIFFCCQLKALSDHSETKKESCIGTILGCGVFPLVFLGGFLCSVFGLIMMVMLCAFIADPWGMMNEFVKLAKAADEGSEEGCKNSAEEGDCFSPMMLLRTLQRYVTDGSQKAFYGTLCDDSYFTELIYYERCENADPQIPRVMCPTTNEANGGIPALCKNWLLAFRFGVVSQMIFVLTAFVGLLICFWVGYKSCCRNNRGRGDVGDV